MKTNFKNFNVTSEFLRNNPQYIFVFGDNDMRVGKGGAAKLRDEPNVHGFITKKEPSNDNYSYYNTIDYIPKYLYELDILRSTILSNPNKIFLISRLGAGLANRYGIWEKIIEPTLKILLHDLNNIEFLY